MEISHLDIKYGIKFQNEDKNLVKKLLEINP